MCMDMPKEAVLAAHLAVSPAYRMLLVKEAFLCVLQVSLLMRMQVSHEHVRYAFSLHRHWLAMRVTAHFMV